MADEPPPLFENLNIDGDGKEEVEDDDLFVSARQVIPSWPHPGLCCVNDVLTFLF